MNTIQLRQLFSEKLKLAGFNIQSEIQEKLIEYLLLLAKWNQAYNLTSVRDPQEMITRHLIDSLVIQPYLTGKRILDVGSGAGLPGIPLALAAPDLKFVLLDSNNKKTTFITQVIHTLKINNVAVINTRVEKYNSSELFDCIMCRAFSSLAEFVGLTQHLLAANGCWLAMKGEYPSAELAELPKHFSVIVDELSTPGINAKRHVVLIRK